MTEESNDDAARSVENSLPRTDAPDVWLGGSGLRLTRAQRKRIIDYCIMRDGRGCSCSGCSVHPKVSCSNAVIPLEMNVYRVLTVDHREKGAGDHHASNVKAKCWPCNNATRYETIPARSMLHDKERREKSERMQQQQSEELPDDTPIGIRLNKKHEPDFRRFFFQKLLEKNKKVEVVTKKELRAGAREYSDTSLNMSYSYVERLFSSEGPLKEEKDDYTKEKFVKFKDPKDAKLSAEELMLKYPKAGTVKSQPVDGK